MDFKQKNLSNILIQNKYLSIITEIKHRNTMVLKTEKYIKKKDKNNNNNNKVYNSIVF